MLSQKGPSLQSEGTNPSIAPSSPWEISSLSGTLIWLYVEVVC